MSVTIERDHDFGGKITRFYLTKERSEDASSGYIAVNHSIRDVHVNVQLGTLTISEARAWAGLILEAASFAGEVKRTPKRIQRKRTKGWKMPENTVYVGRGSKWGNPFTVEKYGRHGAVNKYRDYIGHQNSPHDFEFEDIAQLRGKNLACWCSLDNPCHADVLLEFANGGDV